MRGSGDTVSSKSSPVAEAFTALPAARTGLRPNSEIAADFLELTFRMESGRELPVLSRFEGPITVALTGQVPPSAHGDLDRLLARFRSEAGIPVSRAEGRGSITVEFVPRRTIQATYANVACFVAPRVSSWAEFVASRGTATLDWTTLRSRERMAIFAPADSSPQEVRDCLHEEIAQAMGPLNDLYHLPDSVFNDDNFNTSLTGFDMLVLRMIYAPELRSGMTRAEVAGTLPGLLARLNPSGQRAGGGAAPRTPQAWIKAMEVALGPRSAGPARRDAANRALAMAMAQGWRDSRLAFSHFAVGRVNLGHDATTAERSFAEAARLYRGMTGGHVHAAHVDMQMAALALTRGQADTALALADRAIPVVQRAENAALLATLRLVKAEALEMLGRGAEARALRVDTAPLARYGFGSDASVRARTRDIASLARAGARG